MEYGLAILGGKVASGYIAGLTSSVYLPCRLCGDNKFVTCGVGRRQAVKVVTI